jgi:AmiR/NasT family two-component response regulator
MAHHSEPPPRVLVIMPEHWPRAHVRAALREAGYDAIGALTLAGALSHAARERARGPVRAVVLDAAALRGHRAALDQLRTRHGGPPIVLLTSAARSPPAGDWARTLRRPIAVADVARAVTDLVPLPPDRRRPIDT